MVLFGSEGGGKDAVRVGKHWLGRLSRRLIIREKETGGHRWEDDSSKAVGLGRIDWRLHVEWQGSLGQVTHGVDLKEE